LYWYLLLKHALVCCTSSADAKKPQEKKTLKEEEKDQGVEMTQDFEGEMFDIPSDDEQNNESEGVLQFCGSRWTVK
jgi:hypothetical protein